MALLKKKKKNKRNKPTTTVKIKKIPATPRETNIEKDLQTQLDELAAGSSLELPPAEYAGPIVINKPLILDGGRSQSTIWGRKGPVVSVQSSGVTLKNVRIEVIGKVPKEKAEDETGCALLIRHNQTPNLENVEVTGTLMGDQNEEGGWEYPAALTVGNLAENTRYTFGIDIHVPVSCTLRSQIADIALEPRQLNPGKNHIKITAEPLRRETLINGNLEIQTSMVKRVITFCASVVPEDIEPLSNGNEVMLWQPAPGTIPNSDLQGDPDVKILKENNPGSLPIDVPVDNTEEPLSPLSVESGKPNGDIVSTIPIPPPGGLKQATPGSSQSAFPLEKKSNSDLPAKKEDQTTANSTAWNTRTSSLPIGAVFEDPVPQPPPPKEPAKKHDTSTVVKDQKKPTKPPTPLEKKYKKPTKADNIPDFFLEEEK
jgi:hypothetical protein